MTESTRELRAEAALGGGLFVEARSLYSVLLAAAELEHGFDHPESLRLASCLAEAASGLGERTEAAGLRSRIAAACERLHGRDDDRTLAALHQLAEALYWASNRRDESTWPDQARGYEVISRTLTARELKHGLAHRDTAESAWIKARFEIERGDHDAAQALLERAVVTRDMLDGDRFSPVLRLAVFLRQHRQDMSGLREQFTAALSLAEAMHGLDHPNTITLLEENARLAGIDYDVFAERQLWRLLVDRLRASRGADDEATLDAYTGLARTLLSIATHLGDYDVSFINDDGELELGGGDLLAEAREITEFVYDAEARLRGADSRLFLRACATLGEIHAARGSIDDAIRYRREHLAALARSLGPDNGSTAMEAADVARLYARQGDTASQLALLEQAYQSAEGSLGPTHFWTLNLLGQLLEALVADDRRDRAQSLRDTAVRILALRHRDEPEQLERATRRLDRSLDS